MSFYGYQRALVVFKTQESSKGRLSLVTQEYDINQKGKILRKYSNAKRFSFALGQGVQVSTAYEFLVNKGSVADFDTLLGRFSIEVLTNNFYKEIEKEYDKLWNAIKIPSGDVELTKRDFALRLIWQLIFCWFLRAKNWIPDEILSTSAIPKEHNLTGGNYYHGVLEPLFFDTLNKPESERTSSIKDQLTGIPYLNGGLFEPKTDDFYTDQKTQKSEFDSFNLVVPNENIQSIFEVFERYHFTIDESTSTDQEVGIDPEMMGRIFENFIVIRSETGSFYTPRAIVDYMVDSTLKESISSKFQFQKFDFEDFICLAGSDISILKQRIAVNNREKILVDNKVILPFKISKYNLLKNTNFSFEKGKFEPKDHSHPEVTPDIWKLLHEGQFNVTNQFFAKSKVVEFSSSKEKNKAQKIDNAQKNEITKVTLPKLGLIMEIDNQKFVLIFSVSFGGYLLLDTIHGTDPKKIAKLLNESPKNLQSFLTHIESTYPTKNTLQENEFIEIWQRDAATPIVTIDRQLRAFSDFSQIYTNIISNKNVVVKLGLKDSTHSGVTFELIENILTSAPDSLENQTKTNIITHLSTLRVLDPACGSGAFPMGILQKLTEIIHTLDPNQSIYEIKKNILCNCIYGSDLLPIATEISRLRCWLSLIVDQKEKPVCPEELLPNLEFKFVSANSLVGNKLVGSIIAKDTSQPITDVFGTKIDLQDDLMNGSDETDTILIKLQKIIQDNFNPTKTAKDKIRQNYRDLKSQIDIFALSQSTDLMAIQNYDHYGNAPASFFHPKWMFGVDSFDIVIGNPPYVQLQSMDIHTKALLGSQGYKTYQATGDLYQLFYERGVNILKQGGILAYITSNKWMRAGYGQSTRGFFANHTNPLLLLDLGANVFESATVDSNIIIVQNSTNKGQTIAATVSKEQLVTGVTGASIHFADDKGWFIGSPAEYALKAKIEKNGKPLKDWDIKIYRGVLTGLNEAFIIDSAKRDELVALDPKSAKIIKPILRGRDIKRYGYESAGLFLLFIPWHFPLHKDPNISGNSLVAEKEFELQYPAIYYHLLKYKEPLSKRNKSETGIRYEWYALQRCANTYYEEFNKEKIMYPNMTSTPSFILDNQGLFCNDKAFIITLPKDVSKFFIGVLNSKLADLHIRKICSGLGLEGIELRKTFMENFPIPILDTQPKQLLATQIEAIVEEILRIKNTPCEGVEPLGLGVVSGDTTDLESQIDALVYQLYDLTEGEIAIVAE